MTHKMLIEYADKVRSYKCRISSLTEFFDGILGLLNSDKEFISINGIGDLESIIISKKGIKSIRFIKL